MSLPKSLSVSVIRKTIPVELETVTGDIVSCSLREMTGAQRDQFLAKVNSKLKVNESGEVVGMLDYTGSYSTLLSYCMYDASDKLIDEATIQSWPDSAQKALFDAASVLNGLKKDSDEDEDPEKN